MWHMTIPAWLQLLIYALAVMRLDGLIRADGITEDARDTLLGWLDNRPKTLGAFVAELIQCPWCVSIWVGAVAAPLVWFFGDHPVMLIPALMLAFSQVTGMSHNLGR
jgi:ABC-type transport system involved in cytochrome c biogenesis permease component